MAGPSGDKLCGRSARARPWSTCAAFVVALASSTAHAGDAPSTAAAEATRLKSEGDAAFRALRYADALRAYEASYALVANPLLHYNRGRALEALERFPDAIDELEAYERDASPELRAKTTGLAAHLVALRQRVATVRVVVDQEGARVLFRATVVGTSPLVTPVRVNRGPARIEVEKDGFVPFVLERDLAGGQETTVRVSLVPKATPAIAERPARDGDERPSVFTRWWFWTAAGAVVAGAAVVTYVATRPSPPREGDIGQLTSPLLRF